MKPSVGRIVHYVSYGTPGGEYSKACRAAVVTEVQDDDDLTAVQAMLPETVGLAVLNPTGMFFHSLAAGGCRYDEGGDYEGGTWHWPEKVGE